MHPITKPGSNFIFIMHHEPRDASSSIHTNNSDYTSMSSATGSSGQDQTRTKNEKLEERADGRNLVAHTLSEKSISSAIIPDSAPASATDSTHGYGALNTSENPLGGHNFRRNLSHISQSSNISGHLSTSGSLSHIRNASSQSQNPNSSVVITSNTGSTSAAPISKVIFNPIDSKATEMADISENIQHISHNISQNILQKRQSSPPRLKNALSQDFSQYVSQVIPQKSSNFHHARAVSGSAKKALLSPPPISTNFTPSGSPKKDSGSPSKSSASTTKPVKSPALPLASPPTSISRITFTSAHSPTISQPIPSQLQSEESSTPSPSWFLLELLQTLGQRNAAPPVLIEASNRVVSVLRAHPEAVKSLVFATLGHRIQLLLMSSAKEVVACGYRIARYVSTDGDALRRVNALRVPLFIVHSLVRSTSFTVEREQALKYVRKHFDLGVPLDIGVVRAIVGATAVDDAFKIAASETLGELLVLDARLAHAASAIPPIIVASAEGEPHVAARCGAILLRALDSPSLRNFLRGGAELSRILHPFVSGCTHLDRLRRAAGASELHGSALAVAGFLKTWAGLAAFAASNCDLLRTLVSSLSYNAPLLRDVLMDVFYDVLRIRPLPWVKQETPKGDTSKTTEPITKSANPHVNHYTALLLSLLLHCDLAERVLTIAETSDDDLNKRKATVLHAEIFGLAANLLPRSSWEPHFGAPKALSGNLTLIRLLEAELAAFHIEQLTRKLYKGRTTLGVSNNVFDPYVENVGRVAAAMSLSVDDAQLRRMIDDTQVLFTKRFMDWRWDTIIELLSGPLRIQRRFEECLRFNHRFMKRLMVFYRPFKKRFMLIKKTKNYQKYINTGVALFEMLLSHSEGRRYLLENKLLPQIAECLAQVDPLSGISAGNPIFSSQNLKGTLSAGYFRMLGVLLSCGPGLAMLARWKIFSILHHIVNANNRDAIVLAFLPEFNYTLPSQLRVIFAHALTLGSSEVRLAATKHLGQVASSSPACAVWAEELLVGQLYDPDTKVCAAAVQILDERCARPDSATRVARLRPQLNHLGPVGAPLLLRFLLTPVGVDDLLDAEDVAREMAAWREKKNELYVLEIEHVMRSEYAPFARAAAAPRPVPHHFYGELAKTKAGFQLLSASGDFYTFVDNIRELANETENEDRLLRLKSCLWAVGHVGLSDLARRMVDDAGVTELVLSVFRSSTVWSVKGTAFFVLGMLSSIPEGLEVLDENGWDVAVDVNNCPTNFCVPRNIEEYFSAPAVTSEEIVEAEGEIRTSLPKRSETENSDFDDPIDRKILEAITSFSMTPTASTKILTKLEERYKERFSDPDLYVAVMLMLENYSFKQSARSFILKFFEDKKGLENLIKRDRQKSKKGRFEDQS